jgi:HAD superfamily hydrolase (TIGR01490 family)
MKNLTIFDLDHTLIPLDSEMEWLRYLAYAGVIGDAAEVITSMENFNDRFSQGGMDDRDYCDFVYGLQRGLSVYQATNLRDEFVRTQVVPQIPKTARDLVKQHQDKGDLVVLITGSSAFMTAPIVKEFGILHGIGTEPRAENGEFTGNILGVPSIGPGKIAHLQGFLASHGKALEHFAHSTFYSDSTYDLPLLERVHEPIATNPKPALKAIADERGWQVLHLW